MTPPFFKLRMVAFDTETTGTSAEDDRVVSAAVIRLGGDQDTQTATWLLDPGIDIPADATAVHGITTEYAQAYGMGSRRGVEEITTALHAAVRNGLPIVGHNVSYDLTLLDRECRRHAVTPLVDLLGGEIRPVLDTRVLDTQVLLYRSRVSDEQGARVLKTCAAAYGLDWDDDDAHGAEYDALVAARVLYRIGWLAHTPRAEWTDWAPKRETNRFATVRGLSVEELHDRQVEWAAAQAESLQTHLRGKSPDEGGGPDVVVDPRWPLIPYSGRKLAGVVS